MQKGNISNWRWCTITGHKVVSLFQMLWSAFHAVVYSWVTSIFQKGPAVFEVTSFSFLHGAVELISFKTCFYFQNVLSFSEYAFIFKMCIHFQTEHSFSKCPFIFNMCFHFQNCSLIFKMCFHFQNVLSFSKCALNEHNFLYQFCFA